MPRRAKQAPPERYKEFLRSLRLVGIALVDSHFRIDRQKFFEDDEEQIFVDLDCHVADLKDDHFEIRAKMPVRSQTSKKPKEGSFSLDAVYLLHFHTRGKVVEEFAKRFAECEARLVVWPYLREYVTSMCGRAHVPPISLPMAVAVNEER